MMHPKKPRKLAIPIAWAYFTVGPWVVAALCHDPDRWQCAAMVSGIVFGIGLIFRAVQEADA